MWLFLCGILLVSSCSLSFRPERSVKVFLPSAHPWEEATHSPMPYRVVTSYGEVIWLERGQRSTTVLAPRGETVLVAAYPLDGQYPFTGVIAGQSTRVELTQGQSRLVMGLLSVWDEHGDSLRFLAWPVVEALVGSCADTLDVAGTIAALLNGTLQEGSVPQSGLTTYRITALPQGRWFFLARRDWERGRQPDRRTDLLLLCRAWRGASSVRPGGQGGADPPISSVMVLVFFQGREYHRWLWNPCVNCTVLDMAPPAAIRWVPAPPPPIS